MKRQQFTPAALTSSATDTARKGLQQYYTPSIWAKALAEGLPTLRPTIADLQCGNGSLLAGIANTTTRDALGLDLDPLSTIPPIHTTTDTARLPQRHHAHGDILDLYPLLLETETRFDLLALNPPFSLHWPLDLVPEPLRKGLTGKTIDSTLATLRMARALLTEQGEALIIANASTIEKLRIRHESDFDHVWLQVNLPSFFPGTSPNLQIAVLYLTGQHVERINRFTDDWSTVMPPEWVGQHIDEIRRKHFTGACIDQPWHAERTTWKKWDACTAEMDRRRDPTASNANIILSEDGRLRTWVTAYQEANTTIDPRLSKFLKDINRKHPVELTIQRATRQALAEIINSGAWTITPEAQAAIQTALDDFNRDRAPLSSLSLVQRIGWIDDAEELLCTTDFHHFRAGQKYPLSTETIEWKKTEHRPRYLAGKRSEEEVAVRGQDLRLTLYHPDHGSGKTHFMFNPEVNPRGIITRCHSLEELAAHFHIPEVEDITTLKPDEFAANLSRLEELEALTS